VGSSIDTDLRWKTHLKDLRKQKHCNRKLQRAWNKYGAANFEFSLLEKCPDALRAERETFWIRSKNSVEAGYNIIPTADLTAHAERMNQQPRTSKQRESSRVRMIALNKVLNPGRVPSERHKAAAGANMKRLHAEGRIWTAERRLALSKRIRKYNDDRRGKPVGKKIYSLKTKGALRMTVLVLCHGNLCRSPFAVALLRRAGVENVVGGGFKDPSEDGKRSPKKIRDWALAKAGIDLSEHRSKALTKEMLQKASIIVYMDSGQLKRLEDAWEAWGLTAERGSHHAITRPLAAWLDPAGSRIGDPNFQKPGTEEFELIMNQLIEASGRFAEYWKKVGQAPATVAEQEVAA
jgi:group I intron endonuclease